jgi:hypothetical protein
MRKTFTLVGIALCLFISSISNAASTLSIDFTLPEFSKEDYRKPYVAIWAETKDDSHNLLLWHLTKGKSKKDKWLVDIKRWWRKEGRYSNSNKFDGITGASKGNGKHHVDLDIAKLSEFTLFIEVVRQKGGRSIVRQKINVNNEQTQFSIPASQELGAVTIKVKK